MRIISGYLGGRRYNGKIPAGVRPTSDLARESVFNKLSHLIDLEDAIVADICAGTGAMGTECLSRGAKHCYFVDSSRKSCEYIRQALRDFKVDEEDYTIITKKAEKFPELLRSADPEIKFDIIITDPPYADNVINQLLNDIVQYSLLKEDGIIVAEYSSVGGIILPDELELIDARKFGETQISYIKLKAKE